MNNDNKIKGVKKVENKKFIGKDISKILKSVTAISLSIGLVVTAPQALKMYNEWGKTKTLSNLENIVTNFQDKSDNNILGDNNLKNFEAIIIEYEQAVKNNDENSQKNLDYKVEQERYFFTIYQEINKSIIKNLGYTTEEVEIVMGRDGFYLVDSAKFSEGASFTPIGELSDRVKILDKKGNVVAIPFEMQKTLNEAAVGVSISSSKSVLRTANLYDKLIKLNEIGNNVIEKDEAKEER